MHTLTCDFSALRPVPLGPFSREPAHIFFLENMYRVQTDARVITENTTEIKTEATGQGFLFRSWISRNHEGEVCILFKWMVIKTDRRSTTSSRECLS